MKKAFSVLEMIVVLTIISMVVGSMKVYVKHRKFQAEVKNIVEIAMIYESAMRMYYFRHNGTFPVAELDSDWEKNHLEDVPSLKPYCPIGFNTKKMIKSQKCKDITYFSQGGVLLQIFIEVEDDSKLVDEITRQLDEIAPYRSNPRKQPGSYRVAFTI